MNSTTLSAEPDVSLKTTIRLTDLTRLVGERKQVELQILRLEQALSALSTDAQLNGTLKPEKAVTSDAQQSMAAVEVMIGALRQRRDKLSTDIEAARNKRHDLASVMQEERERKTLEESEKAMKEHVIQARKANEQLVRKFVNKNTDHKQRVDAIWVSRTIKTSKAVNDLHRQIVKQDQQDADKKRLREEEKAARYAEYCRKERDRIARLFQLEAEREEHHESLLQKHKLKSEQQHAKELRAQASSALGMNTSSGTGSMAARNLRAGVRSTTPPTTSTVSQPKVLRGPELAPLLDASDAAHLSRNKQNLDRVVRKVAQTRQEADNRTLANKEVLFKGAMQTAAAKEAKRQADAERIASMRREQELYMEASRIDRERKAEEAIRKSKLREAEFRWSKRANRLITSVCSEVMPGGQ